MKARTDFYEAWYVHHGMVYFMNAITLCLYLYVAEQWLVNTVTAATNTHATIEELLDTSFQVQSLYQFEVVDYFSPKLVV
jgi:hypothetical protein